MSRAFATALLAELDDDGLDLLASVWRRGSRPARAAGRPPTLTAGEAAAYLGPTANALRELGSARAARTICSAHSAWAHRSLHRE
jgi:hypothetical protein